VDDDDEVAALTARYLDTLNDRGRAEFFALDKPDQLDRIGEFIANEADR
jgi:hypothetical protein